MGTGLHRACRSVAAALVGLGLLLGAQLAHAATAGPVTDPLGVIRIPKGAPVVIGDYLVLSGPDTALGLDEQRGIEIAIKDVGGTLLGHPIKLDSEDDQCNAEGGQTAATKLASTPNMVIVLGPAARRRRRRGADPVAGRHRQYLHRVHGPSADRARPQEGI